MEAMFHVYILKSKKDNSLYIGHTNDLARRIAEHNYGHTRSTRSKRPYELLESFVCDTELGAIRLEREWKKGYKREYIKRKYGLV